MKERPILFSGPMVRAILDGRKTQTRRVVKPQPMMGRVVQRNDGVFRDGGTLEDSCIIRCPFGVPGDRLWVRETWKFVDWTEDGEPWIEYAADGLRALVSVPEDHGDRVADIWSILSVPKNFDIDNRAADRRWRPSIHMPRWACRTVLEVVSVRVERLVDISEADAKAEGYASADEFLGAPWAVSVGPNPWVWVVEFKRAEVKR